MNGASIVNDVMTLANSISVLDTDLRGLEDSRATVKRAIAPALATLKQLSKEVKQEVRRVREMREPSAEMPNPDETAPESVKKKKKKRGRRPRVGKARGQAITVNPERTKRPLHPPLPQERPTAGPARKRIRSVGE